MTTFPEIEAAGLAAFFDDDMTLTRPAGEGLAIRALHALEAEAETLPGGIDGFLERHGGPEAERALAAVRVRVPELAKVSDTILAGLLVAGIDLAQDGVDEQGVRGDPPWLAAWIAPATPTAEAIRLLEHIAKESPIATCRAQVDFPPCCVIRCACGLCAGRPHIVRGVGVCDHGTTILLLASAPGEMPSPANLSPTTEIVGYHAGLTPDVVRALVLPAAGQA